MNISKEDAEQSLTLIEQTTRQTTKSLIASYESITLIIWGFVWLVAFLGTHFFLKWVWLIWMSLCFVGFLTSFLFYYFRYRAGTPTKNPEAGKIGRKYFWYWVILFIYLSIWLKILSPISGLKTNAFICSVIMFSWVTSGIWSGSTYLVLLGSIVTAVILTGFYLIPISYYSLWMALAGSLPIIATGLYIKLRWRQ